MRLTVAAIVAAVAAVTVIACAHDATLGAYTPAAGIGYAPASTASWEGGAPTTVAGAVDRVAAALTDAGNRP